MNHPGIGKRVRSLHFDEPPNDDESIFKLAMTAYELDSMGHPRSPHNDYIRSDLWWGYVPGLEGRNRRDLPRQIVGMARPLILEQCSNLQDLSFSTAISFPFYASKGVRSIFSENLKTIKSTQLERWNGDQHTPHAPQFTGRQVLFLLISLPQIQEASFVFSVHPEDVKAINTHTSDLLESGRCVCKVKKLSVNVHLYSSKELFKLDLTFTNLLSIFNTLGNLNLKTFDFEESINPVGEIKFNKNKNQTPTFEILRGLKSSLKSLTSLSVVGLKDLELPPSECPSIKGGNLTSILKTFKKLVQLSGPSESWT